MKICRLVSALDVAGMQISEPGLIPENISIVSAAYMRIRSRGRIFADGSVRITAAKRSKKPENMQLLAVVSRMTIAGLSKCGIRPDIC